MDEYPALLSIIQAAAPPHYSNEGYRGPYCNKARETDSLLVQPLQIMMNRLPLIPSGAFTGSGTGGMSWAYRHPHQSLHYYHYLSRK